MSQTHEFYMARALQLAELGLYSTSPNPRVGCVIVKDGAIVGEGWHQKAGEPHAEVHALRMAGEQARGATAYVTLEPCSHYGRTPPCAEGLIKAGVARVVGACSDPNPLVAGRGYNMLREAGIEVITPCLESQAIAINKGFMQRMQTGLPYTRVKLAQSLDGRTAMASGESQWITGDVARAHVHARRAGADAILVGGGTWRSDKPRLDVRLPGLEQRSPQRAVLTRGVPPNGVKVISTPEQIETLDAFYLYIEAGANIAASFLSADLVDRLEIYRAPIVIGNGYAAVGDIGLGALADAHGRWALEERRQLGSDSFEAYSRLRQK